MNKKLLKFEWSYSDANDFDDPTTHLSVYMGDKMICDFWGFDRAECLDYLLRKLYNVEEEYIDDEDWGDNEDSN